MPPSPTSLAPFLETKVLAVLRATFGGVAFIAPRQISRILGLQHLANWNLMTRLFGAYDLVFGMLEWWAASAVQDEMSLRARATSVDKIPTRAAALRKQTLLAILCTGMLVDLFHVLGVLICYLEGSLEKEPSVVGGGIALGSAIYGLRLVWKAKATKIRT